MNSATNQIKNKKKKNSKDVNKQKKTDLNTKCKKDYMLKNHAYSDTKIANDKKFRTTNNINSKKGVGNTGRQDGKGKSEHDDKMGSDDFKHLGDNKSEVDKNSVDKKNPAVIEFFVKENRN